MPCHFDGKIRLVDGRNLCIVNGYACKGFFQIVGSLKNVVDANDPESLAVTFQWNRSVAQNWNAVGLQYFSNDIGIIPVVVIPKDGEGRNASQFLKDLRTWFCVPGACRSIGLKKRMRNEITGQ